MVLSRYLIAGYLGPQGNKLRPGWHTRVFASSAMIRVSETLRAMQLSTCMLPTGKSTKQLIFCSRIPVALLTYSLGKLSGVKTTKLQVNRAPSNHCLFNPVQACRVRKC